MDVAYNEKHRGILISPKRYKNITMAAEADLPSKFGHFKIVGFFDEDTGKEHTAIIKGDITGGRNIPCRIHSECHTGDVLGSLRCDCRNQLENALEYIEKAGTGVVLYLRQEGRGIGLINKINAYRLQQEGLDTVEANVELGFPADSRSYELAANMLNLLGIRSIRLLSNNPDKFEQLRKAGIEILGRVPVTVRANPHNKFYLDTKKKKMRHVFDNSNSLPAFVVGAVEATVGS
ncbi:MAG: GTP cyclohydrolase II [Spirochaetales bacterium]|nr:GTP cyclohydrolase II [Spirochaetales bacterium]